MFDIFKKQQNKVSAIVVAAGNSTRMGSDKNKQLIEIEDKPVIVHTVLALEKSSYIDEIIIVTKEEDILYISDLTKEFELKKVTHIIKGGKERTDSVKNGLLVAKNNYVAIHDGARPCVKTYNIDDVIKKAFETDAAALGCRVIDTLKRVDENGTITNTVDRNGLWQIQTPQVFKKDLILKAYENVDTVGATDDCMLLESMGVKVHMVEGERSNIKITVEQDVAMARAILGEESK